MLTILRFQLSQKAFLPKETTRQPYLIRTAQIQLVFFLVSPKYVSYFPRPDDEIIQDYRLSKRHVDIDYDL